MGIGHRHHWQNLSSVGRAVPDALYQNHGRCLVEHKLPHCPSGWISRQICVGAFQMVSALFVKYKLYCMQIPVVLPLSCMCFCRAVQHKFLLPEMLLFDSNDGCDFCMKKRLACRRLLLRLK